MMDSRNSSDDELDDGLYTEFDAACTSVTNLFKQNNWRNFQTAATNTTQLYKAGSDASKRAFDKGLQQGRLQLAKELLSLKRFGNKIEAQDLVQLLHKYALLPNDHPMSPRHRKYPHYQHNLMDGGVNHVNHAVSMFQQALNPPTQPNTYSTRPSDLNTFLHNQVLRHRKRAHSPMDTSVHPTNHNNSKRKRL